MQTHNLTRKTKNKKTKLIGRGGKRGKTSGRGTKGQWAHGGHGVRPEMRDIIKKFPKLRGHGKNRSRTVNPTIVRPLVVNLGVVADAFKDGDVVSVSTLLAKGIVKKVGGKQPAVKILSGGDLAKKLRFVGVSMSVSTKEKIEKAGGAVK